MFDGSSIEGFVRIEESDMYLRPDLVDVPRLPVGRSRRASRSARMICDIYTPDGDAVRRLPARGAEAGDRAGRGEGLRDERGPRGRVLPVPDAANGEPTTETHDAGSYFDLSPVDQGEDVRREIVLALEAMGFHVEAAHHEVAPGQHEIDFRYDDVLTTADNISTFRFVVKNVAIRNGLHATFMPKPIFGINGSGMHTHMSLFAGGTNVFYDAKAPVAAERDVPALHRRAAAARERLLRDHQPAGELVQAAGARLRGADGDRLVREEPQPARPRAGDARRPATRIELRMPDPSCNPYLALAVMLRAGLDGIEQKLDPGPAGEQEHLQDEPPRAAAPADRRAAGNLSEALDELEKDDLMRETLGEHMFEHFVAAKREEWLDYIKHVSPWEIERYPATSY